jgi:hypothetical protein
MPADPSRPNNGWIDNGEFEMLTGKRVARGHEVGAKVATIFGNRMKIATHRGLRGV